MKEHTVKGIISSLTSVQKILQLLISLSIKEARLDEDQCHIDT